MSESLGTGAAEIARLGGTLAVLGAAVFLAYLVALGYAALRKRDPAAPFTSAEDPKAIRMVLLSGAVVPALILVPLLFWTMQAIRELRPDEETPTLAIEVVGRQWWWELRYRDTIPSRSFTAANELHIPTDTRVELRLVSPDVIHSFWVPRLQGKMDHVPGKENRTWIRAREPGTYRGQCAEYCGMQHANMRLTVVAMAPRDYEQWAAGQRAPAREPADSATARGRELFLGSGCAMCHAVRGTPAGGSGGPDLTHLQSRATLAAGRMPNTPQNLAGWMGYPDAFKPGTRMPAVKLSGEAFNLIHRYLLSLR